MTGVSAQNKTYDGATTATLSTDSAALSGLISGDTVTLSTSSATGAFDTKTIGTNKTVTTSGFSISGTDSGNYSLTQPTTSADITKAILTVTGVTAGSKTYDGNTTVTLNTTAAALSGIIGPDAVTLSTSSATGSFADQNAGTGKTVTTSGFSISGTDAGSYILTQPSPTADITPATATIEVQGFTTDYDGTAHYITYSGTGVNGESLDSYITINGNGLVSAGNDVTEWYFTHPLGNYEPQEGQVSTTIRKAAITVTADAKSKTYGNADPALTYTVTSGQLYGSDGFTGELDRARGEFAGNYTINQHSLDAGGNYDITFVTGTFTIQKRAITVTAVAASKMYDDKTTATGTPTITSGSLVGNDTGYFSQSFATQHAGQNKSVVPSGYIDDANGGLNYQITFAPASVGTISQAPLTIAAVATSRFANGTTESNGTPVITGLKGNDTASATQVYDTADPGVGKTLSISSYTISDGNSGNNYSVTTQDNTNGILYGSNTDIRLTKVTGTGGNTISV
ncbi:MAG: YDG domain-containing protein, partial [Planctomycetota bacterium]